MQCDRRRRRVSACERRHALVGSQVWYVVDDANEARVLVIHKGTDSSKANVTVVLPSGTTRSQPATLVRLTPGSGGVTSSTGILFGGLTFDGTKNGVPAGTPASESVPHSGKGTEYSFKVPASSIAILTVPSS